MLLQRRRCFTGCLLPRCIKKADGSNVIAAVSCDPEGGTLNVLTILGGTSRRGCDNADVINFCVSSSPASSSSPARECDKCACLVGEQFSGPEWNALHGLRIQRSILLDVHGFLQLSSNPTDKLAKEMTHDLEVYFNRIAPVRKADTAKELQDHAVENAEVAEIQRAVFRALTRLRAATIKEFDTIDSQVGNSSHRRVHHWTAAHGLFRRFQRRLLCRRGLDLQITQCGQDLRHVR